MIRHINSRNIRGLDLRKVCPYCIERRFWAKVKKGTRCWVFTQTTSAGPYALYQVQAKPRIVMLAHRLSWLLTRGPLPRFPPGVIMHTCDNPKCVRPGHLKAGTTLLNMRDMHRKGRWVLKADRRGENNGRTILTREAVVVIRETYKRREPGTSKKVIRDLAAEHGVSIGAISGVVYENTWKHLLDNACREQEKIN